jgi:glutaredoxin-like YruB-family protein
MYNESDCVYNPTPACPFCVLVKNFLRQNGINYEEVDVSENPIKAEYLTKRTGAMSVPVTELDGKFVIGYDTKKLKELLGI